MHINGTYLSNKVIYYLRCSFVVHVQFSLQPKDNIYGSFGIFCPSNRLECVDLLETENILIDWSLEMYLNFTHIGIMGRLNSFYQKYGEMQRLHGDIYVAQKPFGKIKLEG